MGDLKLKKWVEDRRWQIAIGIFLILLSALTYMTQISMEIYAYNLVIQKKSESVNVAIIKNLINMKNTDEKSDSVNAGETDTENKKYQSQRLTKDETSSVFSFIKPVKGGITTSTFGDVVSRNAAHQGHDWAVNIGTKVVASEKGVVEKAYYSDSYGYNILIDHGMGMKSRYAHLSELQVSAGEKVRKNQLIGFSGSTGQSTGPHLHFEVIENGKRVNPIKYLKCNNW